MVTALLGAWAGGCASVSPGRVTRTEIECAVSAEMCAYRVLDQGGRDLHVYEPVRSVPVPRKLAGEWVGALAASSDGSGYPLIGTLASVVLLDAMDRPVAVVHVINWDCNVSINRCVRLGRYYHVEAQALMQPLEVRSEAFARSIYEFLRTSSPETLQEMRRGYESVGENLEALLFEGKSAR